MTVSLLDWVLTAMWLIAVVPLLRWAFGKRIGARLRYALWLLVLVRLLVPVQLFTAPAEAARVLPELRTMQVLPSPLTAAQGAPASKADAAPPVQAIPAPSGGETDPPAPEAGGPLDPAALLGGAWLTGAVVAALVLVWSNLRFAARLRRVRVPLEGADCPLRTYTAPGLPSPCLFGILRPAVYVTPEAAADPVRLRHVLTHEATHFRHGDHIWSALRCAALAVHWWDPLVWLAAVLSRRDAELACDEGALAVLGDGERRAYGNTLLDLVTAKPQPGDLLRCATTMAGDERSLRERIGRIARAPKRWLWAAALSVALAALVCACAFAKTEETEPDGPLTEEELRAFNETVFNAGGFNMRNQFLLLAAEAPEDYRRIDLFQLFYNGTGRPGGISEEERRAVADAAWGGEDPGVDLIKCPASEMDEILREHLGLSLEETDKWGLDLFTYLEDHDAYYHFCGDTNYIGDVTFTSGERKDGKILLYYEGDGFPVWVGSDGISSLPSGPACVVLEPRKDGGYHFLSNWQCDPPARYTAYPAWEPERVIPLDGLEPYQAPELRVERRRSDVAQTLWRTRLEPDGSGGGGFDVEVYRSTDGSVCASVVVSETERDCFLTVPADRSAGWTTEDSLEPFADIVGREGLRISYYGQMTEQSEGMVSDYYTFTEDGRPSLLLRTLGNEIVTDLDGDGIREVTSSDGWNVSRLFFQRDGTLYEADLYALIYDAWPEAGYLSSGSWDRGYLTLAVELPLPGTDVTVTGYRTVFFDGEALRIYKDENGYTDHVANGLEALPGDVLAAARSLLQGQFDALAAEGRGDDGSGNDAEGAVVWDDWRITGLSGPYYVDAADLQTEVWNVSYETHTATPDRVTLAGGSYLGEDGWCMIGYPGCDYLYFRLDGDLERTYLFSRMENDCSPGTKLFLRDLIRALMDEGILSLPDLDGETLAQVMWPQSAWFLNTLAEEDAAERSAMLEALGRYLAETREGAAYYDGLVYELDDGGYRAGELTDGGRLAWEELKDIVRTVGIIDLQADMERIPELTLYELLEFLSKSDGAATESAVTELHQRFLSDPAAVLRSMAEREDWETLADLLAGAIHRDEDLFPGAIEQARALPPEALDAEQSAVRDRIVSVYEARKQRDAAWSLPSSPSEGGGDAA